MKTKHIFYCVSAMLALSCYAGADPGDPDPVEPTPPIELQKCAKETWWGFLNKHQSSRCEATFLQLQTTATQKCNAMYSACAINQNYSYFQFDSRSGECYVEVYSCKQQSY